MLWCVYIWYHIAYCMFAFVIINMYILIQLYINIYICINHPTHISDSSCRILEKACLDNHISVCSAFLSRDATDPAEILYEKKREQANKQPGSKKVSSLHPGQCTKSCVYLMKKRRLDFWILPWYIPVLQASMISMLMHRQQGVIVQPCHFGR